MPSLIDAVAETDADSVEKCCDVEFVAVDCAVFAVADVLDFAPEFDLAVAEHSELQSAFGFAGLVQPLHDERCAIWCVFASDLYDRSLR